ncbi:MAG: TolB family protein, partial [Candidatus Limnocylindria bacterium]
GRLPEAFRYAAPGFSFTLLWLVDLRGGRAPQVVARWDSDTAAFSASRDGRALIAAAPGRYAHPALYVIRPETGETRTLFDEPDAQAAGKPQITPDGTRFAFAKRSARPSDGDLGLWAGGVDGGAIERIAEPSSPAIGPPMPHGWSTDGRWLAVGRGVPQTITLVPARGGLPVVVGDGELISWRAAAPELLIGVTGSDGRSRIDTFDVRTGERRTILESPRRIVHVGWDPAGGRFVYVARAASPDLLTLGDIWLRDADGGSSVRLDAPRGGSRPEWSPDGTMLTSLIGGDDSTVGVFDHLSGRAVATVCRRGGTPGRCL